MRGRPPGKQPQQPPKFVVTDDTLLNAYFRDIGEWERITPKQEIELAHLIKKGGKAGKAARERMINANLRLVIKIARDYENLGLPLKDLISEGNIGLMTAVDRFNPSKGAKLSTYGSWWIKQSIKRALANQSKTIRIPVHVVDRLSRIRRAESKLVDVLCREPSERELSDESGEDLRWVKFYRNNSSRMISIHQELSGGNGEGDEGTFGDIIADDSVIDPATGTLIATQHRMIAELVDRLEPREAAVIKGRFGFGGEKAKTLEEMGQKYGVTRERIRQVQNIALQKLKRMVAKTESGTLKVAA